MDKTLLVAWREFRQRIRSRGFIIQTLLLPIILIGGSLVSSFGGTREPVALPATTSQPVQSLGIVDQAELIQSTPSSGNVQWLRFADAPSAEQALTRDQIGAYYVIPPTYRSTGAIQVVGKTLPLTGPATDAIEDLLLTNLLAEVDEGVRAQVRAPFNSAQLTTVQIGGAPATAAQDNEPNWLPFLMTLLVVLPLFSGGSYLFQSLVQEKSNRVMEILLLALRPRQLLSGKLIGLGALILVQYLLWAITAVVALAVRALNPAEFLTAINLSGAQLLLLIPYALGGFLLYAALMAGIGAMTSTIESNRIWVFVLTLPMLIPLYLWTAIVDAPAGPLAVGLSLFPFSAPVAMIMRLTTTTVPFWQIGVSLLLLLLTGLGVIWFMGRLFRAQTLLGGETLSVRRIWEAIVTSSL